ncbi:YceI family protein [Halobacteriovorax sp. GB3]|uniref:YceI family protein n=1 Tax=Halobacteriovorax sp. GB3 TaxID=2719615 RepID=UPI0023615C35|nr:YceI family protein [Halobacteriovorax sp. GB3]MDD0851780.1 YceI family protein [Halobacteriovorax sp. GB3]
MKGLFFGALLLATSAFAGNVDTAKSEFKWKGTKVTGEHYGLIKVKDGNVVLKDGKIDKGNVVMDMGSIDVTDLSGEWKDKFLTHIKSGDFFEISKYPEAKLEIKGIKGDKIQGVLEIKGKKGNVEIPYKKDGKTYSGKLTFDRTKFDMVYGSGDFFKNLGDKMIHNEVQVDFKVVLK